MWRTSCAMSSTFVVLQVFFDFWPGVGHETLTQLIQTQFQANPVFVFYGPYAWAKTTQQRCRLSRLSFPKNMSFSTTTAHMPNLALFGCWTIAKIKRKWIFQRNFALPVPPLSAAQLLSGLRPTFAAFAFFMTSFIYPMVCRHCRIFLGKRQTFNCEWSHG